MSERGNLILMTRSPTWPAAIRRLEWPTRISWALDVDDVFSEAALRPGSVVVVEFSEKQIAEKIDLFARLVNSPYHLALLAVGDCSITRWRNLLMALGYVDVFWSTTQVNRLRELASRHFEQTEDISLTLEEQVLAELPWSPALTINHRIGDNV